MSKKPQGQSETNLLLNNLLEFREWLMEFFDRILVIIGIIVLVAGGWAVYTYNQMNSAQQRSTQLHSALAPRSFVDTPEEEMQMRSADLEEIADNDSDGEIGKRAQLLLADTQRNHGSRILTSDRDGAETYLRMAERAYETLTDDQSTVSDNALFGRAKALEALGDLQEARLQYQALLDKYPARTYQLNESGGAERLDLFLFRKITTEDPPVHSVEDVLPAIQAGLVQREDTSDSTEALSRYDFVQPNETLRVQIEGPFTLAAKQRLNALNKQETGAFYDWFQTVELPANSSPNSPGGLPAGLSIPDSNTLPVPSEIPDPISPESGQEVSSEQETDSSNSEPEVTPSTESKPEDSLPVPENSIPEPKTE